MNLYQIYSKYTVKCKTPAKHLSLFYVSRLLGFFLSAVKTIELTYSHRGGPRRLHFENKANTARFALVNRSVMIDKSLQEFFIQYLFR